MGSPEPTADTRELAVMISVGFVKLIACGSAGAFLSSVFQNHQAPGTSELVLMGYSMYLMDRGDMSLQVITCVLGSYV